MSVGSKKTLAMSQWSRRRCSAWEDGLHLRLVGADVYDRCATKPNGKRRGRQADVCSRLRTEVCTAVDSSKSIELPWGTH